MKPKKAEESMDGIRDDWAMVLFGKPEAQLEIAERVQLEEYVYDCLHPVWKTVETDRGDLVEVSNVGQVRDPITKELYKVYVYKVSNEKALYPIIGARSKDGKLYLQSIHRLVAKAFIPNPENKPQVNHINGIKNCNWYKNLEWVTCQENIQHAVRMGLLPSGENHYKAKYSNDQVRQVCELLCAHPDWTFEKIESETGVAKGAVSDISRKCMRKSIAEKYTFPKRQTLDYNSETKITEVCELLKNHPDITYEEINKKTGVSVATISLIYSGKQWQFISNNYQPFPPRETRDYFTEDQVRHVCEILANDNTKSYNEIEDITGVDRQTIGRIYRGDAWKYISDDYKFQSRQDCMKGTNNPASTYTDDVIREICELKNEVYLGHSKMTRKEIAKAAGVPLSMVKHVIAGEVRTDISSLYDWYNAKKREE